MTTPEAYCQFDDRMFHLTQRQMDALFRSIVSFDKSLVASNDQRLKRVLGQLITGEAYPEASEPLDPADIAAMVAEDYNLDPDEMNTAYNLCLAQQLRKNVDYGEA